MNPVIQGNTYYSHAFPPEELERNFRLMKAMGIDMVRVAEVWPGWSVLEPREEEYDFTLLDDYVRKAGGYGLSVCMGIGITDTPMWAYRKYPDLRFQSVDGSISTRRIQSADFTHPGYRTHMADFIRTIVGRYQHNPVITSWQFGNEIRFAFPICDTPSIRRNFRQWLRKQYGNDIDLLNRLWFTQYATFDDIYPYKSREGAPTEGIGVHYLASKAFQNAMVEELVSWGVALVKEHSDKPVFHNNFGIPGEQGNLGKLCQDADVVCIDIYASTYENPGFYNGFLLDAARSVAQLQHKPLWIGETGAGQYGTFHRTCTPQRMIEATVMEDIAAGAQLVCYFRHKASVWEQPHKFTGSQTLLRIDESELPYAQTPKDVAAFLTAHGTRLQNANPVFARIALYDPTESILLGKEAGYDAVTDVFGARAALAGLGYPVDILDTEAITTEDLSGYQAIYLPVCFLLPEQVGRTITAFVRRGGVLISEGRPAYVDDRALLYTVQPGAGLDELFGAREDLFFDADDGAMTILDTKLPIRSFLQTFRLGQGKAIGTTEDGTISAVQNGNAYLFGSAPGALFPIGSGKYESKPHTSKDPAIFHAQRSYCQLLRKILTSHGIVPPLGFDGIFPQLSIRYREEDESIIVFLMNYDQENDATLVFDGAPTENWTGTATPGREVTIKAGETQVLVFSKPFKGADNHGTT